MEKYKAVKDYPELGIEIGDNLWIDEVNGFLGIYRDNKLIVGLAYGYLNLLILAGILVEIAEPKAIKLEVEFKKRMDGDWDVYIDDEWDGIHDDELVKYLDSLLEQDMPEPKFKVVIR
jgi:hypothetical protein